MSASADVTIWCDECEMWDFVAPGADIARRHAKAGGWAVALPAGRDLCPNCRNADTGKKWGVQQ